MKVLQMGLLTLLICSLLFGCSTNAPLTSLSYRAANDSEQKNMIIFLRGRGGSHEDFYREGFVEEIQIRQLPYDMVAPNSHFGYYFGETLVPRLKADIIEPAKARGYDTFWLVGASMGGLGALMYARQFPEDVAGIYVISPFLGYDAIIDEISGAGGLYQWNPGEYDPTDDWQRMLWHWLKQCAEGKKPMPELYLGFGTEDSYANTHDLLTDILPSDHVFTTKGGHTPETMKEVWTIFLNHGVL